MSIIDMLQRVLNAAARIASDTHTHKYDRGLSHLLHDVLHWLGVPQRISTNSVQLLTGVCSPKLHSKRRNIAYRYPTLPVGSFWGSANWHHLLLLRHRRSMSASIGHIWFPISLPLQLCLYLAPLTRHWSLISQNLNTSRDALCSCYISRGMADGKVSVRKSDLQGHSRALAMVPFHRPYTIF